MSDHIMMCNVPNAGACFVPSCACGCHKSTEPKVADPIIPSTGEVRADYVRDHTRNFDSYMVGRSLTSEQEFYGAKFDRWLAAHDAEVLREAANALDETIQGLNRENPLELAYINCTHIDAQEVRHRAARIERGER